MGRLEEAEKIFQNALKLNKKSANIYYELGYTFLHKGQFEKCEKYLRKAIECDPRHFKSVNLLLILLLNDDSRREEGLKTWADFTKDKEIVRKDINYATNLFVGLAGVGYQREALEILRESAWAEALEPVVVALRLMQGEDVKAAAEIMEVAKDVVKRIEDTRKQMESTKKNDVKK
jgi:tetratricopeptide (TPR) repeat protein